MGQPASRKTLAWTRVAPLSLVSRLPVLASPLHPRATFTTGLSHLEAMAVRVELAGGVTVVMPTTVGAAGGQGGRSGFPEISGREIRETEISGFQI